VLVPGWHCPVHWSQQPVQEPEVQEAPPSIWGGPPPSQSLQLLHVSPREQMHTLGVGMQVPVASQHPAQFAGPHTAQPALSEQYWPPAHDAQLTPAVPHAPGVVPGWHTPAESQHPLQLAGLQGTHPRLMHFNGAPHEEQVAPPVPQATSDVPGWHVPEESQQPPEHVAGPQRPQTPLAHIVPPVQFAHAAAPEPQAALKVPRWQFPAASQQPAQVSASHGTASSHAEGAHKTATTKTTPRRRVRGASLSSMIRHRPSPIQSFTPTRSKLRFTLMAR
jgi:hypothetical protein